MIKKPFFDKKKKQDSEESGNSRRQNHSEKNIQRLMIILIMILINITSVYVFYRMDLTKNKSYTLSRSTRELIKLPKEELRIKLFFSSNIPAEILTTKNYVKDLLSEYQSFSRGKIYFEFVNASDDKKFKKEAIDSGIPSITVQVMEKDKMEYREIFIGMLMTYQGNYEKLPVISSTEGLEYQISSAISRLVFPYEQKIAYFTPISHEESQKYDDLPDDMNFEVLGQLLSDNYIVDRTDLFYPLPDETDLLIVSGIRDSLDQVQLYYLDQYIMSGKPVLWFQDRYLADINADKATLINSNAIQYLFDQSLYIKPNLVMDAYCYQISKYKKQGEYTVPVSYDYPFFPVLQNHNQDIIITRNLGLVQSLFASELFYKENQNLMFTPLLKTSISSSELMGNEINTGWQQFLNNIPASSFTMDSKVIAGIYEGKMNSYFLNKSMKQNQFRERTDQAKILLIASNSFAENEILANIKGNSEFILNAVDYLCGNQAMIEMRSRTITYSPLRKTTEQQRFWVKLLNFVLPVFMIFIIFFILHIKRKLQNKKIKRNFYR